MRDPITGRDISNLCWNGSHERVVQFELYGESWDETFGCDKSDCGCLCHPRNQVIPVSDDQPRIDAAVEGCPNDDPKEAA